MVMLAALFGCDFRGPPDGGRRGRRGVSIPIIIHLLNRTRFQVVTWAAMRFLLAAQRKNSRRMRLEQLLLLIVRCLMVLLLVLAMASVTPWAEAVWHAINPRAAWRTAAAGHRTHKILVLDGSFSMGLKQGDSTCFEKARTLAAQIVRDSSGGDGFSVVLMASPPRRIVPEPSEDARKVGAEIDALRLTHGNADLAATLSTVESLVQASPGKYPDREVYFLTDLQQSTWIARQPSALAATLQKIQARRGRSSWTSAARAATWPSPTSGSTSRWPPPAGRRPSWPRCTTTARHATDVSVRLFVGRARPRQATKVG